MDVSSLQVVRLSDRPDLADPMWAATDEGWPAFMMHDPVGNLYYPRLERDLGDLCLMAITPGDEVIAKACFLPVTGSVDDLPDRGWDAIVERGIADHDAGRAPTMASALEIMVAPAARGLGLSTVMLDHMRRAVAELGLVDLVAPVRPSGKHAHQRESMADYLARRTDEGLPADPWLRVHARAGATIVKVAPESMVIEGTPEQWHEWTGVDFDHDGEVEVPEALAPVMVDLEADRVTYIEPNVWVHHDLRD
ncbi:N-acetyltransferase [Salsipaludibacter albus]|uniref:N-acetyltransferase n=1 Tax=Salsipaludibacter albus TaxID=2849650 RepID=UPI001EE41CE3|nr:N-acetyltransferase [Salsipaludibacter albus]MBY5163714.1 N-acetyltransferase [Salsipaludibacter albus]